MRFVLPVAGLAIGLLAAGVATSDRAGATTCGVGGPPVRAATPPFTPSRQLATLAQVEAQLPFTPLLPPGRPYRIYVKGGPGTPYRLGLAYVLAPGRWFKITEDRTSATRASFEEQIRFMAAEDFCGQHMKTVRLSNGELALLIESDHGRKVRLQSGRISAFVSSSAKAMSSSQLIRVANGLVAADA